MTKGRNTTVMSLRLPDTLIVRMRQLAERGGVSLNEWCRATLTRGASLLPSGGVRRHDKKEM